MKRVHCLLSAMACALMATQAVNAEEFSYFSTPSEGGNITASFAQEAAAEPTPEVSSVDEVFSGGCSSCGGGCDGGCMSCACCDDGWIKASDPCFNCFISPMTNPFYFEDPRTLTEARFIYAHHKVPLTPAGGGEVDLFAVQLRAALTDKLSLIAVKDGYYTSSNPIVDDGWNDVTVGLKYNLRRDVQNQTIVSAGVTYELPVGSTRAYQGNGDGVFNFFLSRGQRLGRYQWLATVGGTQPVDTLAESSFLYMSNHLDRKIAGTNFYGFAEANWFHYTGSGTSTLANGFEGFDLINFGAQNVTGNDIVTGALGVKYKPSNSVELGFAWEAPLTERRDIIDNRLTADFIWRY